MNKRPKLTLERAYDLLIYNPDNGELRWCRNGKIAGTIERDGYRRLVIDGERLSAHRVIWFMSYGHWPEEEIDHKNRVKDANFIENIWDTSHAKNMENRAAYGLIGVKGVYRHGRKFVAKITRDGISCYLGSFTTIEAAAAAFKAAASGCLS